MLVNEKLSCVTQDQGHVEGVATGRTSLVKSRGDPRLIMPR